MNTAWKRAQKVTSDALEQAAQAGVARAIAARKAAVVELNGTDTDQISGGIGGILGADWIINGGRQIDLGLVTSPATNVASPVVQGAAGLAGVQGIAGVQGLAGVQGTVA